MNSNDKATPINGAAPERAVSAELTITMYTDGGINISGPLDNGVLCYGMLETGKDCVRTHIAQQQAKKAPRIQVPALMNRIMKRAGITK